MRLPSGLVPVHDCHVPSASPPARGARCFWPQQLLIGGCLVARVGPVRRRTRWSGHPRTNFRACRRCLTTPIVRGEQIWKQRRWGVWEVSAEQKQEHVVGSSEQNLDATGSLHAVRLCLNGHEVGGCFQSRTAANAFQSQMLREHMFWPGKELAERPPCRSPTWDHPEEFELLKEYFFSEPFALTGRTLLSEAGSRGQGLSKAELQQYQDNGFLMGLPILEPEESAEVRLEFDKLLSLRIDNAPSDKAKFRAAHTIPRPLQQAIVERMVKHTRVLAIVEDILGPEFVCWSAHLFCKLPGDPTEQPWHQDSCFWPLSQSRALTLWIAFDDVDESNAGVSFIKGSHRLGHLPWQKTDSEQAFLTSEIPRADLLGTAVSSTMRAGEASVHSDLTVHGSVGNHSSRRRAGLALRFVSTEAKCLGAMLNGYKMNGNCILPRGKASDPAGHWRSLRRRSNFSIVPKFPRKVPT